MSVAVALAELHDTIARFERSPYLMTVDGNGRPRAVGVHVVEDGGQLSAPVGTTTAANIVARPAITFLWPPTEPDGFSLIVDATGHVTVVDDVATLTITPTSAVLHRPRSA